MHPGVREVLARPLLLPNGVAVLPSIQAYPLALDFSYEVVGQPRGLVAPPTDDALEKNVVHGLGIRPPPIEVEEEPAVVLHPGAEVAE
eukprot:7684303-Pyramimonas_sp.AAC.1